MNDLGPPRFFVSLVGEQDHLFYVDAIGRVDSISLSTPRANDVAAFINARIGGLLEATAPKFKVGDRVTIRHSQYQPPTAHVVEAIEHTCKLDNGYVYQESQLELAPPEPRATVYRDNTGWRVKLRDGGDQWFHEQDVANHVAAGLNEHPEWAL